MHECGVCETGSDFNDLKNESKIYHQIFSCEQIDGIYDRCFFPLRKDFHRCIIMMIICNHFTPHGCLPCKMSSLDVWNDVMCVFLMELSANRYVAVMMGSFKAKKCISPSSIPSPPSIYYALLANPLIRMVFFPSSSHRNGCKSSINVGLWRCDAVFIEIHIIHVFRVRCIPEERFMLASN